MSATSLMLAGQVQTWGSGATNYVNMGNCAAGVSSSETSAVAGAQTTWRRAGTFSNLRLEINSNRGAFTLNFRKNTATGNLTLTTSASPVGEFSDTTHTDTVAAGDKLDFQGVNGTGGSQTTFGGCAANFAATVSTMAAHLMGGVATVSAASTTTFAGPLGGDLGSTATEANVQQSLSVAGTMANLATLVMSNARGSQTDYRSRIGAAFGNLITSYAAAATGVVEDTTHSDTIAVGSLVNLSITTGTGGSSITLLYAKVEIVTTVGSWHTMGGAFGGAAIAGVGTRVLGIGGGPFIDQSTAARAIVQVTIGVAQTATRLGVMASANADTAATVSLCQGGVASALVVNVNATGWLVDTTHSVATSTSDKLDLVIVKPGAGAITFRMANMLVTGPGDTSVGSIDGLTFTNVASVDGLVKASTGTYDGLA